VTQAKTPEAAEVELVETDELSPFGIGNQLKQEVLS
jgi:hypothetical protein